MDPSDITENTELSRFWAEITVDAFSRPDNQFERLYELAERDQWAIAQMDWDAVDFSGVPRSLRQGAANMFTQLHYGEVTALLGSARLVDIAPSLSARLFSSTQVNDEARHVQWFSRLIEKLDCRGEVRDSVTHLMQDVYECDSVEGLVVGMHILVEGMAHSFFMEGARVFSNTNPFVKVSKPFKCANTVIGDWLPNYLGRDESRHIAFGVQFLNQYIPELTTKKRDALEMQVSRWGELFIQAAGDPSMQLVAGLEDFGIPGRCIKDLNQRLEKIGLEARIPEFDTTLAPTLVSTPASTKA